MEYENLRIFSVISYVDAFPAFVMPLAIDTASGNVYVQILGSDLQTVIGFSQLDDIDLSSLEVIADIPIEIGDKYIHGFVDRNNELYLNSSDELFNIFSASLNDPRTPYIIKILICEQMRRWDDATYNRNFLLRNINDSFGRSVASNYENSSITAKLWELLEIVQARRFLHARARPDRTIELDLSAIDPTADLRVSVDHIANILSNEFLGTNFLLPKVPVVNLSMISGLHDPTVETIISAIKTSPRQEERISILMRAILIHPESGRGALTAYDDKAKFANSAIEIMRRALEPDEVWQQEKSRELTLANIVPKLFTRSYPLRRGEILFYLASYLKEFPNIKFAIRDVAMRSQSHDVLTMREQILSELGVSA
jgi:hypothetical protein